MEDQASGCEALYILGDLFEYWVGDDDLGDPFNRSIVQALSAASERGVALYFMRGNRDFLIGEAFSRASGAELLEDAHVAQIGRQRTLLLHGDTLCSDDLDYQRFRAQVRAPEWRRQFLAQPLARRKAIALQARSESEARKQLKPMEVMDVTAASVNAALRAHDYPRLIHGHTHRPARHAHHVDERACERWVLPDWYEGGGYLRCDEAGARLQTLIV